MSFLKEKRRGSFYDIFLGTVIIFNLFLINTFSTLIKTSHFSSNKLMFHHHQLNKMPWGSFSHSLEKRFRKKNANWGHICMHNVWMFGREILTLPMNYSFVLLIQRVFGILMSPFRVPIVLHSSYLQFLICCVTVKEEERCFLWLS